MIRFQVLGIPFTLLELMIFTCFAIWVICETQFFDFLKNKYKLADLKKNRKNRKLYPFSLEIIGVLLVSFFAIGVANFSDSALGIWKAYFFEPTLVFILVLNVFKKDKKFDFNYLLWPLALSAFFVSVFAIFQKITGQFITNPFWADEATRRVTSFFAYPNAVGLYLGPIAMILIGFLFANFKNYKKNIFKIVFLSFVILISVASIYFARSEGALIAILGASIIFVFLGFKRLRFYFIVFLLVLTFGIVSYVPTRDYAINKFMLKDLSGEIRKQQWRETWQMLEAGKIFFGSGLSKYQEAVSPYHQEGIFFNKSGDSDFRRKIVIFNEKYKAEHWQPVETYLYPHNFFLNFWTELGILGMVLFSWIFIKFFILAKRVVNKNNKFLVLGLVGAMLVIFIHGLVDVPYFKNDLAVIFWIIIAMLGALKLEKDLRNTKC